MPSDILSRCSSTDLGSSYGIIFMDAHDRVMVDRADQAGLTAVMGPQVLMVFHARVKGYPFPDHGDVQVAVKIDPFPAVVAPGPAPAGNGDAAAEQFPLQHDQVFAYHGRRLPAVPSGNAGQHPPLGLGKA